MTARPQPARGAIRRSALLLAALAVGLAFVYRELLAGRVIATRDAFRIYIPDSALLLECLRRLEPPLWNPYVNLGQPFAGTLQSQALYPPRALTTLLFGPVPGYTVGHLVHAVLAAVGTYRLCRRLRRSPLASAFAAGAFGLSPLFTWLGGLGNIASSAAWSGFLLLAAHRLAGTPSARRVGALAAVAALSFLCGSPETLIWQGLLALLAIASAAPRRPRALAAGAGAFAWATGLAAAAALPAVELALHSTRGTARSDPLTWSTSWAQILSIAWPSADQPRGPYWGPDQWLLINVFMGSCAALLALLGARSGRRSRPFALGAVLFGALSLGAHLAPAAWVLTRPPLNLFRFPAKYLVGACFCLAVLAAFGLDRLAALARRIRPSPARVVLALAGGLVLLVGLPLLARLPPFRPGAQDGALWLALFSTGLIALFFAVPAGRRRPRRARAAAAALAALELCAVHLTRVSSGPAAPSRLEAPSALAGALPHPFTGRISVDVYGPDHGGSTLYTSVALRESSRDALVPNRFVEEGLHALEGYGAPEPERVPEFNLSNTRAVFDLTGVRAYVRDGAPPFGDLTGVPVGPGLPHLYLSSTAMPRAFVVQQARGVPDAEALALVTDAAQPARRTALLASGEALSGAPCDSKVQLAEERANTLRLDVDACAEGYLILTDAYYPGWTAEVDGAPAAIHRADYALRAVRVPAGPHRVLFRYRPMSFTLGAAISMISLLILARVGWRGRSGARDR